MEKKELDNILKWYKKTGLTDNAYDTLMYELQMIQKDYPTKRVINKDGTINKILLESDEDIQQVLNTFKNEDKTALIFKDKTEKEQYNYGGDFFNGYSLQEKIDTIVTMNKLKKDFIDIRRLTSEQIIDIASVLDVDDKKTRKQIKKVIKKMQGQTQSKLAEALRNL